MQTRTPLSNVGQILAYVINYYFRPSTRTTRPLGHSTKFHAKGCDFTFPVPSPTHNPSILSVQNESLATLTCLVRPQSSP